MVTLHIDDSLETLGQETDDLEPGLLAVSKPDVAGNQSNGILVCRQRRNYHAEDTLNLVGLSKICVDVGKRVSQHKIFQI